ncbi:MAG: putative DNA binding domain-containing protein [Candidatus Pacebacteria bacterium]|nr:putative DNA binding domain-containing protein [Candidatus Paceibacterota bacterium]
MEKVEEILNIPEETQAIEFKRLEGKKVVKKTIQTIVAMANTDGGTIIFGIDDPEKTQLKGFDRIFGIEENKELVDEIFQEIKRIIPPISNLNPNLIKISDDKTIALLNISKATESFYSIDDRVWIRLHKSNKKLIPQEIVKFSYAKGFEKADKELADVSFELLQTSFFEDWRKNRKITEGKIEDILFQTGLARKNNNSQLNPTRAAVLLFAQFPANLLDTKCAIRIIQLRGTIEKFGEAPNYLGNPKTIGGPIIDIIRNTQEYVLSLLKSGVVIRSGFINTYKIPERAVKEAITNAVIHRDYHLKRDIEIRIFEDRLEILSPGLFPYNITKSNIGYVRSDGERNNLLVEHLREFPEPPNLNLNEGVRAMRIEMNKKNLYQPIFFTYPMYEDSVNVVFLNEEQPTEWEKIKKYLEEKKYLNNKIARDITGVVQTHKMSRMFRKWVEKGLLLKIEAKSHNPKDVKYKLANIEELQNI